MNTTPLPTPNDTTRSVDEFKTLSKGLMKALHKQYHESAEETPKGGSSQQKSEKETETALKNEMCAHILSYLYEAAPASANENH